MKQYFRLGQDNKVIGIFNLEDDKVPDTGGDIAVENINPFPPGWPQGPTPTSKLYWIEDDIAWVETLTLEELKAVKKAEITKAKVNANMSYFVFEGKSISVVDPDFREMQSVNGFVLLNQTMPLDWPGGWKAIDNSYVSIPDVGTWVSFWNKMVNTGIDNFNKSQTLKAQVDQATTIEEVAAISWNS